MGMADTAIKAVKITSPVEITVNGRKAAVSSSRTLLDALRGLGIEIPTLCHLEGLKPYGACRLCVVEVEGRPNLIPSCAYPVQAGMAVKTHSERVRRARKTIVELLLANHPDDCLVCVRNGDCELQELARETGVRERRYQGEKRDCPVDDTNPSVERDPNKCVLCGKCVRVCEEVQGVGAVSFTGRGFGTVVAPAFGEDMHTAACVYCGQCVLVCPTDALREKSALADVWAAIADPDALVVAQVAPAVRVAVGAEYGLASSHETTGRIVAALRRLGVDVVFDTQWSADLTIMEEARELVERVKQAKKLPLLTSCSAGWVKFVEHFYPEFLENLSSCKSPQQMLGAVVKRIHAFEQGINPRKIFLVSIMPCTAKKFEAERPEMQPLGSRDVDAVVTTRELLRMFEMAGVRLDELEPEAFDNPLGESTGAGTIFGTTGGVAEAALRTAYWMLNGKDIEEVEFKAVRGLAGIKEAQVSLGDVTLRCAVVNGLANARRVLDGIKAGARSYDFVEVMACPGGCIGGGGQPRTTGKGRGAEDVEGRAGELVRRMEDLYALDATSKRRCSHENPTVLELYRKFLNSPGSREARRLLHTSYHARTAHADATRYA